MPMWVSMLESLRATTIALVLSNLFLAFVGGFLAFRAFPGCDYWRTTVPIGVVALVAILRIIATVEAGIAQEGAANSILDSPIQSSDVSAVDPNVRLRRRVRYKKWHRWTRVVLVINILQFLAAIYLICNVATYISADSRSGALCLSEISLNDTQLKRRLLVLLSFLASCLPLLQCFAGSDIMKWKYYFVKNDDFWRAHYLEVFDHGIREVMCCLGRARYLSSEPEEDEVYSVARLLGDLVTYRASGMGHLELLTGLALLQKHGRSPETCDELVQQEASKEQIQGALSFHAFAEAAYTGPLLDLGRHYVLFSCAWLYRQGILTPWKRNRRPKLTGDNWWRGHAAAFLKYVDLPPEVLRKGRVCPDKCQAAYFIVVLHSQRTVTISVRGTETPEDLITDGLARECILSRDDLDGLISSSRIDPDVKQSVESSFPHYAHSGIVEAARDLYEQIEGRPPDIESESRGFLSSLLGAGCECEGYRVRVVGHSLGGSIAALLGLRLYGRFPYLHVYSFGPLPCVDLIIAEACSGFITSIVHDNEFSSRLSVRSVLRLRAAAITALSQDSNADTVAISRLAYRCLDVSKHQMSQNNKVNKNQSLWNESNSINSLGNIDHDNAENPFASRDVMLHPLEDPVSEFLGTVPTSENESPEDPPEMFLPGIVIHLVPEQTNSCMPLYWGFLQGVHGYKAYLAKREDFKDIVVSPSMFTDHFPWRCQAAMQEVLKRQNVNVQLDESNTV
ncbi:hypothetical protein K2173_017925 [Erythroxylum novogranatense]|uniref:Fungal lipase-like domain-containing protein n=1 Tax=Erythroxylum novogranatense TaxID=1862640 RepID=A0AAV8TMD6_9ROSI|nr:hypothetical protein K2173_017925 [Erythroxylum novogranatense]